MNFFIAGMLQTLIWWIYFLTVSNIQTVAKSYISCASLVSAMRPVLQCCCVAAVNPPDDYQIAVSGSLQQTDQLISEDFLIIGPEGCILPIKLREAQKILYKGEDTLPHIKVAVSTGADEKQLTDLIRRYTAQTQTVVSPLMAGVEALGDDLFLIKLPEPITLPESMFVLQRAPFVMSYGPSSELSEVPSDLWAKHKNHVGRVTTAPPHVVQLKANAALPEIRQYNLPQRAIADIEGVIKSLLSFP